MKKLKRVIRKSAMTEVIGISNKIVRIRWKKDFHARLAYKL